MNGTGNPGGIAVACRARGRDRPGRIGLAAAEAAPRGPRPVSAPPASAHTAAEQAAVTNWLVKTNQMWTSNDFAAVDQVTAGQMRTLYLSEQRQASLPKNASRVAFQLTGLSITIPCHAGAPTVFVAYADTDVFDLGSSVQSVAMVFERTGGLWKLATAVNHADGSRLAGAVHAADAADGAARARAGQLHL